MEPTYMKLELGRWDAQKEEEEGGERQKEEEWLLIKERGGGNRHRFNVSKGAAVEGWRLGTTSQTFIKK